jgi:arginine transport system permease protein
MDYTTYLTSYLSGIGVTLMLMFASILGGLFLAIVMTIASFSDSIILRKLVSTIIFFIRGTPLLVQIFLIYFGLGQFEWLRESFLWPLFRSPTACAIISLSLNSACYTSILLQGAINSVPKNEIAACYAVGMSKWLAFRRIIFPRAFRIALPAYSNEVVMILKGTSLASTITLLDIMGVTQQMISDTYQTVTLYCVAGVIYLILHGIITFIFSRFITKTYIVR